MISSSNGIEIVNEESASRYVMTREGEEIGFLEYRLDPPTIVLTYIEVDPALRGSGLGEKLATVVLEDCRARGLKVTPRCGWMAGFMRANHEQYADLLAT
jgi:predicted GNAT family acetyltransferase